MTNEISEKSKSYHHFCSQRHVNVNCHLHLHFHMEIILVTEGTLNMTVAHQEYSISAGYGLFVPALTDHSFHSKSPNKCHVLMFSDELIPSFFEGYGKNLLSAHLFCVPKECQKLVEKYLPNERNRSDDLKALAVLAPLCIEIREQCQRQTDDFFLDDQFVKALEFINLHFDEELSLQKVAKEVGLHPVTLSKKFSKHSTVNFNSYLNYLRCTHAAMMIEKKKETISEIAFAVGFGSISSFNRAFKETFGVTPSSYKKSPSSYYQY